MGYFDLLNELRTGEPDVEKARRAMKVLGWLCILGALWNFAIYFIAPFDKAPFNLPLEFPYLALVTFLIIGALFLRSSQGIGELKPWGRKMGQVAVFLLLGSVLMFMYGFFPDEFFGGNNETIRIFFLIFAIVILAQFALPAYFGIRYLSRLPVQEPYPGTRYRQEQSSLRPTSGASPGFSMDQAIYKEALLPFGVTGTFLVILAVPMLVFFLVLKYGGPEFFGLVFGPMFLLVFLGAVFYNNLPSSFQQKRNSVASFTGGGSLFLFQGSWPFFRLIVYKDGLEVRVMFHRFFIPYDKMEDLPNKVGFFTRGLLIKSDLPDVPSRIRFAGFGMKKIVQTVNEARRLHIPE